MSGFGLLQGTDHGFEHVAHKHRTEQEGEDLRKGEGQPDGVESGHLTQEPGHRQNEHQLPQDGAFDLAVSNPPFFPAGGGKTALGSRGDARSELTCTMAQLCGAASYLLRSGGQFCLVYRPERLAELLETLRRYRLEPKVLRFVQKNGVSAPSLVLLACRKDGRTGLTVQPPLLLQNADGTETEELRRIYFKDKG